jgi:O-methyltransferase
MDVYQGIAQHTLVSPDRCYLLARFAQHAANLPGSFAEAGVFRGGTALMISRLLADSGKTFYLFDSFQGLPAQSTSHDNYYREGAFKAQEAETRTLLRDYEGFLRFRVGWIPQTFAGLEEERFPFVHVDIDLYQPALDCCAFFYPRLVPGGVMIFDDYGFPACRGEKEGVDEFFADKLETPIVLPTGQALVVKLASDG